MSIKKLSTVTVSLVCVFIMITIDNVLLIRNLTCSDEIVSHNFEKQGVASVRQITPRNYSKLLLMKQ